MFSAPTFLVANQLVHRIFSFDGSHLTSGHLTLFPWCYQKEPKQTYASVYGAESSEGVEPFFHFGLSNNSP